MKTNRFTILFTIVALIMLFACEDPETIEIDDIAETSLQTINVTSSTIDELPKLADKIQVTTSKSGLNWTSKTDGESITLDESRVLSVKDSIGNITYSIRMFVPDAPYNIFYNVIAKQTANGEIKNPFIIKYEVDEAYAPTYFTSKRQDAPFKGVLSTFKISSFEGIDQIYGKNDFEPEPCYSGDGSGDEGSGGSGNGSGGSGGGGTDHDPGTTFTYHPVAFAPDTVGSVEVGEGSFGTSGTDGALKRNITGKNDDCPEDEMLIPINEEDKITNKLTGKAKCVYDKLQQSNLMEHGIIQNTYIAFNDDLNYSSYFLTYSEKKLLGTKTGETKFLYNNNYEVILNSNYIANRAPIEIARTILHESIHALLLKHAFGDGTDSFIDIFRNYLSETNQANDLHHAIMRDKYVIPIAKGLQLFDNSSEDFSYYENLALSGLHQELTQEQLSDLSDATNKARNKGLDCE